MGIPEEKEGEGTENLFQEIKKKNLIKNGNFLHWGRN